MIFPWNKKYIRRRKLWTDLLRSGAVGQATGSLQDNNGAYCCLGVACLAYERDTGIPAARRFNQNNKLQGNTLSGANKDVATWLGLKGDSGSYLPSHPEVPNTLTTLVRDNDHHGKSFLEIADIIDSKPKLLFKRFT